MLGEGAQCEVRHEGSAHDWYIEAAPGIRGLVGHLHILNGTGGETYFIEGTAK